MLINKQTTSALAQMNSIEGFIAKRRANFTYLKSKLVNVADFLHLPEATPNSEPSWSGFSFIIKNTAGVKRAYLISLAVGNRIATHLLCAVNLTKQPRITTHNFFVNGKLMNTCTIANQNLANVYSLD